MQFFISICNKMSSIVSLTVLLSVLICNVHSLHLASYIKACKVSDPDFKNCALTNANNAIPSIVKGDKTYKVIPTNPGRIPKIDLEAGPNLKLSFTDLVASGIEQVKLTDVDFDLNAKHATVSAIIPNLVIDAQYKAEGKILSFPVNGNGNSHITFEKAKFQYAFDWQPHKKDDGLEYMKVLNTNLKMQVSKATFQFENIVNADLSKQINQALNDSWEDVMAEIGIGIEKALQSILDVIVDGYISNVPYNEILLP